MFANLVLFQFGVLCHYFRVEIGSVWAWHGIAIKMNENMLTAHSALRQNEYELKPACMYTPFKYRNWALSATFFPSVPTIFTLWALKSFIWLLWVLLKKTTTKKTQKQKHCVKLTKQKMIAPCRERIICADKRIGTKLWVDHKGMFGNYPAQNQSARCMQYHWTKLRYMDFIKCFYFPRAHISQTNDAHKNHYVCVLHKNWRVSVCGCVRVFVWVLCDIQS